MFGLENKRAKVGNQFRFEFLCSTNRGPGPTLSTHAYLVQSLDFHHHVHSDSPPSEYVDDFSFVGFRCYWSHVAYFRYTRDWLDLAYSRFCADGSVSQQSLDWPLCRCRSFSMGIACCGEVCENVVALVSWKCGFFLRFPLPHLRFIRHCMLLRQPAGFIESLSYETETSNSFVANVPPQPLNHTTHTLTGRHHSFHVEPPYAQTPEGALSLSPPLLFPMSTSSPS